MRAAGRNLDPKVVRQKMKEFRKDEAAFYKKYGGGPSTIYDLLDDQGRTYPPAAIVQAALGREDIKGGLKHSDSAGVALRDNGFRVVAKGEFRRVNDASLDADLEKLKAIQETEEKGRSKRRLGATILRKFVLQHRVKCEITGIADVRLLRVSHIVAWSEDEAARLDPDNVILLSALWDAAFDSGLVSFDKNGMSIFGKGLSAEAKDELSKSERNSLAINEGRAAYLAKHRSKHAI